MTLRTTPYSYQIWGARQLHRFGGRGWLSDEMGLGKTIQTLMFIDQHPNIRPVVVVCPASLKWNWERECSHHIGLRADILDGEKVVEDKLPINRQIIIINYDILGPWLKWLKRLKPQLIVADEFHYVSNKATKRSRNLMKLCKGVPNVIGLSGTPLTKRPADLWNPLRIIRPDLFPIWYDFAFRYCAPKKTFWGWDYSGAENLDELHNVLTKTCMIRRTKDQVLTELPKKQRTVVPLEISNRKEYNKAKNDFLAWLGDKDFDAANRAAHAEGLVKLGWLKRLAGQLKLQQTYEWIDNFLEESDGKIILFAVHRDIITKLYQKYKNISVVVDGSVTGRDRMLAVDKFQKKEGTRIFIGNIKAAGIGLNLTAASTVAFIELGWLPTEHVQAEDRAHRIGTKYPVSVYYLVAKDTIEHSLCKILQARQKVVSKVLDGTEEELGLDVYDQLVKELKGAA